MQTFEVPTFDQLIDRELSKYDEVVPKIEEIKAELMPLKIESIDDKEGYEKVSKAIKFVVSKRTAVEQKRKELKADSLAYGRAVDARAKEITDMLSPVEEHLKAEKQKIDDLQAEIERQKQEAIQQKIRQRAQMLLSLGCFSISNEFVWSSPYFEQLTIPAINLETMDDNDFNQILEGLELKVNETIKRKAEEDRLKKEEEERMLEQKRILHEQMEALRQQQAELQRQKEEAQTQILSSRLKTIEAMGCKYSEMTGFWFYMNMSISSIPALSQMTETEWNEFLEVTKGRIENKKIEIEAENIKKEQERQAEIERIRIEAEAQAAAKLKAQQEEAERLRKEQEESLSDSEKLQAYVTRIMELERPNLSTKKWNNELLKIIVLLKTYL